MDKTKYLTSGGGFGTLPREALSVGTPCENWARYEKSDQPLSRSAQPVL